MWRFRSFIALIIPVVPIVRGHFHRGVSAVTNFGNFFSWDAIESVVSFFRKCRGLEFAVQALPDVRSSYVPEDPSQVAVRKDTVSCVVCAFKGVQLKSRLQHTGT